MVVVVVVVDEEEVAAGEEDERTSLPEAKGEGSFVGTEEEVE